MLGGPFFSLHPVPYGWKGTFHCLEECSLRHLPEVGNLNFQTLTNVWGEKQDFVQIPT